MALASEHDLSVLMLIREGETWRSLASPAFARSFGQTLLEEREIDVATDAKKG
jgi:thiamine biosynthesis lipoprotein